MPWLIADARPKLVKAIVSLEPTGPPFQEAIFSTAAARPYGLTDIPLTYSPAVTNPKVDIVKATIAPKVAGDVSCILQATSPTPRQLINLKEIPVTVITTESSYHVPYDWCTVKYLQQAGVRTQHIYLANSDIHGNAHLMFLEKNSDQVAELLMEWIESGMYHQ